MVRSILEREVDDHNAQAPTPGVLLLLGRPAPRRGHALRRGGAGGGRACDGGASRAEPGSAAPAAPRARGDPRGWSTCARWAATRRASSRPSRTSSTRTRVGVRGWSVSRSGGGRAPRETAEATRHEALEFNLAFADAEVSILCPYDAALDGHAIACSHRTHPELIRDGACADNPEYAAGELAALDADPLPPAPGCRRDALAGRRSGRAAAVAAPAVRGCRFGRGSRGRSDGRRERGGRERDPPRRRPGRRAAVAGARPDRLRGRRRGADRRPARRPAATAGGARPTAAGCGSRTSSATSPQLRSGEDGTVLRLHMGPSPADRASG